MSENQEVGVPKDDRSPTAGGAPKRLRRASHWSLVKSKVFLTEDHEEDAQQEEDPDDAAIDQLRRFLVRRFGTPKAAFKALDLNANGQISLSELTSSMNHYQLSMMEAIGNCDLCRVFRAMDVYGNGELSYYELFETTTTERAKSHRRRNCFRKPRAAKVMNALHFMTRLQKLQQQRPAHQQELANAQLQNNIDPVPQFRRYLLRHFTTETAAFAAIDKDGNGQISLDELQDAFEAYGLDVHEAASGHSLTAVFAMMDVDLRGEITVTELFRTTEAMRKDPVVNLRQFLIGQFGSDEAAMKAITQTTKHTEVTLPELRAAFVRLGLVIPATAGGPDLRHVFTLMDVNGDGGLSFFEMFKTTIAMREDPVVKLRQALIRRFGSASAAFAAVDTNGDGQLSLVEMKDAFGRLKLEGSKDAMTEAEVDKIFKKMDVDGLGKLSFFEMFQTSCAMREAKKAKKKAKTKALEPKNDGELEADYSPRTGVKEFKVEDDDIKRFPKISAFSADPEAKKLDLKHEHIGKRGAQVLAVAMGIPGVKRNLKLLQLEGNYIGSDGVHAIVPALELHCKLQRLVLSWNGIADGGAIRISALMKKMTSLSLVDLAHNRIGNAGANRIAKALKDKAKSALKTLDLQDNPIGGLAVRELHKACGSHIKLHLEGNVLDAWSLDTNAPPRRPQVLSPLSASSMSPTSNLSEDADTSASPTGSLTKMRLPRPSSVGGLMPSRPSSVGGLLPSHMEYPADGWAPLSSLATALADAAMVGQGTLLKKMPPRASSSPGSTFGQTPGRQHLPRGRQSFETSSGALRRPGMPTLADFG